MQKTLKTKLTKYKFDVRIPSEKIAYSELCKELKNKGLKCFESHGGRLHYLIELDGQIELETKHLFDNQWNTAPVNDNNGHRVFDWAQDYQPNRSPFIKQGYFLEVTRGMREVRDNTCACGYCGKQEPSAKGLIFCPYCIGSEYMTESELYLTRMQPVSSKTSRTELTQAEKDYLLPLFIDAKIHGNTERDKLRIAKERASIKAEFEKVTNNAKKEFEGKTWLMDHGINMSNVIYYSHTGRFCFGWRNPIGAEREVLTAKLEGFPFEFDIK